ncbi:MAG: carboxypeptidase regulatory-like domain-containing protein [Anaerolineales bacterium]|nr:carboxypeptidase regulatory-like domain-containing protein [Anaerolineales bacterium]
MRRILIPLTLLMLVSLACDLSSLPLPLATQAPEVISPDSEPGTPEPLAEVTFQVTIPDNTPPDQPVSLNTMEEATGLALSSQGHPMDRADDQHYAITLQFPVGTVIKYRYSRQAPGVQLQEHISDGRQVRYRLYRVEGPGTVEDVVNRWTDTEFTGVTGRISGQVMDASDGSPVPNLLVNAGGNQVITASDGSYLIEGLPAGTHNLVVYAMDGSYQTFQQGATVAADSTTPAQINLNPARMVEVTFKVKVPEGTFPVVPLRLAGNLYQLGNTFSDLAGGVSTLAARMPALHVQPDGVYTLTLTLPAGADLHYLYTLGDGIWNAELGTENETRLRQIIIPDDNATIEDEIERWVVPESSPITFDVTTPQWTPAEDSLSIQFKPIYGWTPPIPMWRLGANRWGYILNSPLHLAAGMSYRFCRNDQCGYADDLRTSGGQSSGLPIDSSQAVVAQIESWAGFDPLEFTPAIPEGIAYREDFITGVELQAAYHPSWTPLMAHTVSDVQRMSSSWVVFTPTWGYTRGNPPVLEPVPGQDAMWADMLSAISLAQEGGMNFLINPTPRFPGSSTQWWASGRRDFSWWQVWFERYRNFILHYADLAAQTNAQGLVLGGDWIAPAMPDGVLSDGAPSGVPKDAETRWRLLIQEVRTHYQGPVWWALPYSQARNNPPVFLNAVDGIYLLWYEPLTAPDNLYPSQAELESSAAKMLDNGLRPFKNQVNKPIILSVAYPSAVGASAACVLDELGACVALEALAYPNPDNPTVQVDFQIQADLHAALLAAVNQRDWINGYIARGYFPPAMLQDKSPSLHGKPAEELVASWFYRWSEEPETQ